MLLFITSFAIFFCIGLLGSTIIVCVKNAKVKWRNTIIANRPICLLFDEAMVWPTYRSEYNTLRNCMVEEKVRKAIARQYLINSGLIGYRKEKIEL